MKSVHYSFLLFFFLGIFAGCSPYKKLKPNEYLVNKNIIKIETPDISEEELVAIVKQKPNRKVFKLVRFHLGVYNLFNYGKENKVKNWFKNTIGEPPVIYDTAQTKRTVVQMEQFLQNKGYFNARVTDSVLIKKRKKVNITYHVKTHNPYIIDTIHLLCPDSGLYPLFQSKLSESHLKKGMIFNSSLLQKERERITKTFKDSGYYYFNKEFIQYEIDSNYEGNRVSIYQKINRVNENTPDVLPENHKKFKLGKIFILTSQNGKFEDSLSYDTTIFRGFYFLYRNQKKIVKPSILARSITFHSGETYNAGKVEQSYQKLSNLSVFKFINIKFIESGDGILNCLIQLNPLLKQSWSIETEGTHSLGGNLGIGGNFNYRNKNLFKGAEFLEFKIKGGLEFQKNTLEEEQSEDKKLFLFNTIEIGPEINLSFQKFLLPFRFKNVLSPGTTITTAYNYQERPEFKRTITNFSLNYNWRRDRYKRYIVTLFEINGVKIDNTDLLTERLKNIQDRTLLNSYKSHLTTASRFTFIYNNQEAFKQQNVTFFTGNIELAGNTLRTFNNLANSLENEGGSYLIFGLSYAQYARNEFDFRIFRSFINTKNIIAGRLYTGIGIPYGNSQALPFIKTFFAGGSTDIKAWEYQRLGPGSYGINIAETGLEQTGDIKLEGNAEYRFNLIQFNQNFVLEGASFIDAGNIWLLKPDISRPGAEISSKRFYKEIAVGGGFGARLNFGFIIIRLDYAKKLRDPARADGDRWIANKLTLGGGLINFGIGYPF